MKRFMLKMCEPIWSESILEQSNIHWYAIKPNKTNQSSYAGANMIQDSQITCRSILLLSGIWEMITWKTSTMMGRWNCQPNGGNMKKGKIKSEMEVFCGQWFGKDQKIWPTKRIRWNDTYITNPFTHAGCNTRSIFMQSLTSLKSVFLLDWLPYQG